jgi:hypothetical protein
MLTDLKRCHGTRQYPAYRDVYFCPLRLRCWRFCAPRDPMNLEFISARFIFGPPGSCEDFFPATPSDIISED